VTLLTSVRPLMGALAARLYDFLRTQGVNADTTLPSFFVGEGSARIWKGEPFEQAMATVLNRAGRELHEGTVVHRVGQRGLEALVEIVLVPL
jgi:hypothetical protein